MGRSISRSDTELIELRARLAEAEETLNAIRSGAGDGPVFRGPNGEQVLSLKGADQIYRMLVEGMNEGAVTMEHDGRVLYSNVRFAEMLQIPLEKVLGSYFVAYVADEDQSAFREFLLESGSRRSTREMRLRTEVGATLTVLLSANPLPMTEVRGICVIITDITDRKQMEVALRDVSRGVLDGQERERRRVARELHDGISQLLASARHRLAGVEQMNGDLSDDLRQKIVETRVVLERGIQEVRLISRNLRPSELDDLGLLPALRALLDEVRQRTALTIHTRFKLDAVTLPEHIELTIYRIVQECLNNVERHAQATELNIYLGVNEPWLVLRIADNGVGFDAAQTSCAGLGLLNIQERAALAGGSVSIKSFPRHGTTIMLKLPFEAAESNKN
jgi:PAS domain S-box-containing protein